MAERRQPITPFSFAGIERGLARQEARGVREEEKALEAQREAQRRAETQVSQGFQSVAAQQRQQQIDISQQRLLNEAQQRQQQLANEERARDILEINRLEKRIQTEKNPAVIRSIGGRINALTTKVRPGSPNMDFERLAQDAKLLNSFQKELIGFESLENELGPDDPTVLEEENRLRITYGAFPKQLEQIRQVTEPTAEELGIAKEERAFERKKELAGLKVSGVDEKISFMEREDPQGNITRVPIKTFTDPKTGKFVFQVAEEFVPEQAVVAEEPAVTPTEAVEEPAIKQRLEALDGNIPVDSFLADFDRRNPGILQGELTEKEMKEIEKLYKRALKRKGVPATKKDVKRPKRSLFGLGGRGEELGTPFKEVPERL